VPVDTDVTAWQKFVIGKYPRYQEALQVQVTTTNLGFYVTPHFDIAVAGAQISGTTPMIISKYPMNVPIQMIGASVTNGMYQVSGHQPHASFPIDFGDQDDLTDWYDTSGIKNLQLQMKGGSGGASSVVNVVAQQLRRY
jgi:hypothetical protein